MSEMLLKQGFQWHLTANFNRATTIANGRDKLKAWSAFVDRKLFGRDFYKKPKEKRLYFVAVPEIGVASTYLHYHLLAKLPVVGSERFPLLAEDTWRQFVTTGTFHVQRIGNALADQERVVNYDLKDAWRRGNYENIIFSDEFSSHPA